jgi:hypothetical protein
MRTRLPKSPQPKTPEPRSARATYPAGSPEARRIVRGFVEQEDRRRIFAEIDRAFELARVARSERKAEDKLSRRQAAR